MRYTLPILIFITLFITGCTPIGYNTNMSPRDAYFLDLKKDSSNYDEDKFISDSKTEALKNTVRKKGVEDMTFGDVQASGSTYQNRNKYAKKYQYKIVAEDMKIDKFLYYIFQESLKTDFYIDPKIKDIKETITLKLDKRLTKGDFVELLKELLKPYKVKIEEKDDIYRAIFTSKFPREATGGSLLTSSTIRSDISNDTIVTQYIECDYIDSNDFMAIASGIFYKDVMIKNLKSQNGFIVNGTYEQIKKILNFKNIIDRPFMKQKQTSLVYFDYITPSDFKKQFIEIMSYQNLGTEKSGSFKLLALDDINALMVIASNRKNLQFLLKWKNKLDSYTKSNDIKETYFYTSKYRSIEEIFNLVSQFNNQNMPIRPKRGENSKQADKNKKEFVKTQAKDKNASTPNINFAQSSENGVKIVPDIERNVLIIQATPAQYKKLLEIIQRVDTQPLQILVEANIIEVTLQDDLQYGVEWFLRNSTVNNPKTGSSLNIFGKTAVGLGASGFLGTVSSEYFNTVLNMFAKKELINVLSHPKIMVLNGETAMIQVGENIPILSSTMSTVANPESSVSTVAYSNTGITLNVEPSVTSSGVVTMKISQTISKGQKNALSSISSPIILNRQISTKVVLRDNQSIIMGGLIQQDISDTNTKVPILGDLPIINGLFRSTSKNITKTELVLVLKVHIIDNFDMMDEIKTQFNQLLTTSSFENNNISVISNSRYLESEEPSILIAPENLNKYYNGDLDKYHNKETIETIQEANVEKISKPVLKSEKSGWIFADDTKDDMPIQSYTTKKGWVFADDNQKGIPNKAQIEIMDGKTYRLDSDGDYVLVE